MQKELTSFYYRIRPLYRFFFVIMWVALDLSEKERLACLFEQLTFSISKANIHLIFSSIRFIMRCNKEAERHKKEGLSLCFHFEFEGVNKTLKHT